MRLKRTYRGHSAIIGLSILAADANWNHPLVGQRATQLHPVTDTDRESTDSASPFPVRPDVAVLDFGDIPTTKSATATLRLTNHGTKPHTLMQLREKRAPSSNLRQSIDIAPGQTIELQYTMGGGSRPAILNKTVTIICKDQPVLVVPVRANVVSFVEVEPAKINLDLEIRQEICLRSIDGKPFRILSAIPDCIDFIGPDPSHEHIVALNTEALRSHQRMRKVLLLLDHPKCGQVCVDFEQR